MILKYKTTFMDEDRVEHDKWNYIDGISDCSVYYDSGAQSTCVAFTKAQCPIVLALHGEAYLINDNGRTIEKIAR